MTSAPSEPGDRRASAAAPRDSGSWGSGYDHGRRRRPDHDLEDGKYRNKDLNKKRKDRLYLNCFIELGLNLRDPSFMLVNKADKLRRLVIKIQYENVIIWLRS